MSEYPCAYCGMTIVHGEQPVSTYAQCWLCWRDDAGTEFINRVYAKAFDAGRKIGREESES